MQRVERKRYSQFPLSPATIRLNARVLKDQMCNMTKQTEITLDNLTSALKAVYGQKTEAVLLLFRHWVRTHYDIAKATPEDLREIEQGYLQTYHSAKSLDRDEADDLLDVYGKHFFKTATPEERTAFAITIGYTPLEYEIMGEGFSMRELMQALKIFDHVPDDLLIACFERYEREWQGRKLPITAMPRLIAIYRREPAMKSMERARAILKAFRIKILNCDNPDDMKIWKQVSRAREH
jgi:hypothetical protein